MGMNSFNHYAYGCVLEWLFAAAAGIRQEEGAVGWSRFLLAPVVDRRLGHLEAEYRSPAGTIKSAWRCTDGGWTWTFTVPDDARAIVIPPGSTDKKEYGAGTYILKGGISNE